MDIALQAIPILTPESIDSGTQHASLPSSQQWEVSQLDAKAFEQAINNPTNQDQVGVNQTEPTSLADDVLSKMQSLSSNAAEKGEELERLIVKATNTLNPMDVIQANRVMSEYYLENLMTAKLVGNATKAVERLTSLN